MRSEAPRPRRGGSLSDTSWRLKLRFWGVRGSIPTPCRQNLGFGGNTTCVQAELPQRQEVLIFDAGSGIRDLGIHLAQSRHGPLDIHLFLSHFHWDHVLGLPFFGPIFDPRNSFTIYSSPYSAPLRPSVAGVMSYPYFPVSLESDLGHVKLVQLDSAPLLLAGAEIQAFEVHHPQGACGYRISVAGASAVFVPDREPGVEALDRELQRNAHGAGLLIHDAQYTPEEYPKKKGWGHSTWADAVQVAREAQIHRLVLWHHDPAHDDDMVRRILEQAEAAFPNTEAAAEGSMIEL
jgi:phosphoribosyl 1,2-cyclic phosphodiesterase